MNIKDNAFFIVKFIKDLTLVSYKFDFILYNLAERKGFEPSIPISQNTRFPSARLKPLGHLS
tara:strand:+ start:1281 stop:1466 length:186 start_codon:yes stop_codon:yes gene_type:complete